MSMLLFQANYPFLESCKKEIKENHCLSSGAGASAAELAKVLLCLETAVNDGKVYNACILF